MLKSFLCAAFCAASLAPVAAAVPSSGMGDARGRIIDVTCYGPCAPGTSPRPFGGTADVVATDPKTGGQVGRVSAKGGRYRLPLPPGRWRIVAVVNPEQNSNCWQGNPRRVRIVGDESVRRRLNVENTCIQ